VVGRLEHLPLMLKVPGSRAFVGGIFQKLSVHPAGNGNPTLLRAGEDEGDGEREWRHLSCTFAGTKSI